LANQGDDHCVELASALSDRDRKPV
jgi:hypothetical protein